MKCCAQDFASKRRLKAIRKWTQKLGDHYLGDSISRHLVLYIDKKNRGDETQDQFQYYGEKKVMRIR